MTDQDKDNRVVIIDFPRRDIPISSSGSSTFFDVLRGRFRSLVGRCLNHLRAPGMIRSTSINDPLSGQQIEVAVQQSFVKLTVNGRDYYFDRLTGKFDGTGLGCG